MAQSQTEEVAEAQYVSEKARDLMQDVEDFDRPADMTYQHYINHVLLSMSESARYYAEDPVGHYDLDGYIREEFMNDSWPTKYGYDVAVLQHCSSTRPNPQTDGYDRLNGILQETAYRALEAEAMRLLEHIREVRCD